MNLKRGLLRLWLVLTLLWVMAMTWLLWSELTITKPRFLIASSHNGRYEIDGPEGATREQALEKFYSSLKTAKIGKPEDRATLLAARAIEAGPDAGSVSVRSPDGVIHEFPTGTSTDVINRTLGKYWQSKLAEFRQKYPQYDDMSDAALADALYSRFYSDMTREQFNAKVGLTDEQVTITEEPVANWPRRRSAVAVIFLPPLAVLAIGAGLFWTAQRFLRRDI
jgi:hypothetical protein